MEIKAVKFRKDGFYSQPFVMGGEDGAEKYDKNIRYRGSLQKRVIDLNDPPATIPVGEITFKTKSGKYVCSVCGYVYDPAVGDEKQGIPAGTAFEDLPDDWHCPRCKKSKDKFNPA